MKRVLLTLLIIGMLCAALLLPASAWDNAAAKSLLNAASLTPLTTGYTALDQKVANVFASLFSSSASTYEKVKLCYDYINTGASYQGTEPAKSIYSAIDSECNYYTATDGYCAARAYNFLLYKKGSCIDFADAFMVLARAIGLECYVMHGTYDSGSHYWNLIKLNGSYYIFDTEADWAISGRNGSSTSHSSFCLLESADTHRSCNRAACIAEFGNFRCRNKTNNPGTVIPGSSTPISNLYTTGSYLTDEIMNFRSAPSTSAGIYCEIPVGTTVFVMEVSDCWGKITYNGNTGWLSLEYSTKLNTGSSTNTVQTTNTAQATSSYQTGLYRTDDALNFRSNPSLTAGIYTVIPVGVQLTVTEVSGAWGKTVYLGQTGWVSLEYCTYKGAAALQGSKTTVSIGDANGDGRLTAEDARLILRHFVGLEMIASMYLNRSDVSGDGKITPEDARIVLRKSVHLN